MFETPANQRTVTIKLKRRYVADLLLACLRCAEAAKDGGESGTKWDYLHDTLREQLDAFDKKLEENNGKK